jgi:hypothetical protein
MKRRKEIADRLRKVLATAETVADECMVKDAATDLAGAARERDRYLYKLGALESGLRQVIRDLEAEESYGRIAK